MAIIIIWWGAGCQLGFLLDIVPVAFLNFFHVSGFSSKSTNDNKNNFNGYYDPSYFPSSDHISLKLKMGERPVVSWHITY